VPTDITQLLGRLLPAVHLIASGSAFRSEKTAKLFARNGFLDTFTRLFATPKYDPESFSQVRSQFYYFLFYSVLARAGNAGWIPLVIFQTLSCTLIWFLHEPEASAQFVHSLFGDQQ